ncbi:MAG: DNA repair protein RecO C-terminal domain-containing protein [Desulfovibrio sp.]|nr:DNA repair protein RecO C-terminal domain-containing protein [Desulfovibrio sp.]
MNEQTSKALVLRIGHFREIDLWVRLLVPSLGIVTAFAFGGAKSRRRFCGCLDVLNTLSCRYTRAKHGDCYTLLEADLEASAGDLRTNWRRMPMATNCLRFLEHVRVPPDNADELFGFMENFRNSLATNSAVASLFPFFFRFALACRLGYAPDFVRCGVCKADLARETAVFVQNEGISLCKHCRHILAPGHLQIALPASVRWLLQGVRYSYPQAWSDAALSAVEKRLASDAIDGFLSYHLEERQDPELRRVSCLGWS